MPKKIFCAALTVATIYFAAVLIFVNAAAAEDVWIHSTTNYDYYVMTDTFVNHTQYRNNRTFEVDVKYFDRNDLSTMRTAHWSFRENDGLVYHSINHAQPDVFISKGELSEKIWLFGLKHLGIDYEVRYD